LRGRIALPWLNKDDGQQGQHCHQPQPQTGGGISLTYSNGFSRWSTSIEAGFEVAELESRLLATCHQLPRRDNHQDPFDRLLVWQAISSDYTLITHDSKIDQYRADGLQLVLG